MMDREDIKLNVVSSISDEYIDEVTLARIEAKRSVAKRKKIFLPNPLRKTTLHNTKQPYTILYKTLRL